MNRKKELSIGQLFYSVSKKSFRPAAAVFETLEKFQKPV